MAKILIIDDSIFMRMQMKDILQNAGHQVLEAAGGEDGLQLAAAQNPDAIILDLLMPGIGGVEVLEKLRDQGVQTPVIVHTADIQDSTRQQCLDLGARAFLNKPPKPDELLAALKELDLG